MKDMNNKWTVVNPHVSTFRSEAKKIKAFATLHEAAMFIEKEAMKGIYKIRGVAPEKRVDSNYIEQMVLLPELKLEEE
jgi:hypothetical protein